jgi:enoyl-CoA hydratase
LKNANNDGGIRAVLITGAGRSFNAGGDIREFSKGNPNWIKKFNGRVIEMFRYMEKMPKPIVAAINGLANIESFQACDLVVADEEAKFGLPEINIGVCPGAGITIRLPKVVGKLRAKELLMTGEWISSEEAKSIGLVNRVVPKGRVLDEGLKLASKLASFAPLSLGAIKRCVNEGLDMSLDEGMEFQLDQSMALFDTKDLKEGLTAFLEKRQPNYSGN